jgi:hypothetical protein
MTPTLEGARWPRAQRVITQKPFTGWVTNVGV